MNDASDKTVLNSAPQERQWNPPGLTGLKPTWGQCIMYVPGGVLIGFLPTLQIKPDGIIPWVVFGAIGTSLVCILAWRLLCGLLLPKTNPDVWSNYRLFFTGGFHSLFVLTGVATACICFHSDIWEIIRSWKVWLSVGMLGGYAGTTYLIAGRINSTPITRRVGKIAWNPAIIASITLALLVTSFWEHGLGALTPWLTLWVSFWLISRTFYFSNAVRNWSNPDWIAQVVKQLLRGLLLLQGCLLVSLLPVLPGAIALGIVFVLFPLSGLLQRKQGI